MGDCPVLLTDPKEDGSVAKREDTECLNKTKTNYMLNTNFQVLPLRVEVTLACCTGRQKKVVAFPINFCLGDVKEGFLV